MFFKPPFATQIVGLHFWRAHNLTISTIDMVRLPSTTWKVNCDHHWFSLPCCSCGQTYNMHKHLFLDHVHEYFFAIQNRSINLDHIYTVCVHACMCMLTCVLTMVSFPDWCSWGAWNRWNADHHGDHALTTHTNDIDLLHMWMLYIKAHFSGVLEEPPSGVQMHVCSYPCDVEAPHHTFG